MSKHARSRPWLLWLIAALAAAASGARRSHAQVAPAEAARDTARTFTVDGQVALHALMSLSDAHLQRLADALRILAGTDAARSGEWERIRAPLAEAARMNVPAAHWFARTDGSYWTLEQGRASGSRRTVLYRRSPVTRWWYGFGMLNPAARDSSWSSR